MLSGTGSPVKLSGCRATDAGIDGDGDLPDMARMGENMSLKYVAGHGILPGSCNEFQFQKTWPEIRYECRDFTKCQRRAPGSGVCAEYHRRLSGYLYLSLPGCSHSIWRIRNGGQVQNICWRYFSMRLGFLPPNMSIRNCRRQNGSAGISPC